MPASTDITVLNHRPDPTLDAEIADLLSASVAGWPDQQPFTAALVGSMLRPVGLTATTLVVHRDATGALRAAAALRWPATLEASGCLWGPLVRPGCEGAGLATTILKSVASVMATHPGVTVTTSEIPESRTAGWSLFERAGWRHAGTAQLLKRSLPAIAAAPASATVRAVRPGEYIAQALATLVAAARPELGYATARDTYAQWTADVRYVPGGLLLAEAPDGLHGAALVYPSQPSTAAEPAPAPAEALVADLVTAPHLDAATLAQVRHALVVAALRAAATVGASVARAVVDKPELVATMQAVGFEIVERYRYYTMMSPALQVAALAGSGAYARA